LINRNQNTSILLRDEIARLFILSFAVFLFILFFQPFPLGLLEYNDRLLYVTGFGVMYFLFAYLILVLLPKFFPQMLKISECEKNPPLTPYIILLVLTILSFTFYIRYVGKTPVSIYIVFKVFLVCLLPLIILKILYKNKSMETIISVLKEQNRANLLKLNEYEKPVQEEEFEIISENKSDRLSLKYRDIVFVKSADNYIEVYYIENNLVEKKMVRNTLKNIENQLFRHPGLIKCHRTRIVNINYIDKIVRDFNGYCLKMNCFDEKLPVSRQFLMQVREAIQGENK
jgi:hypothetical protein